MVAVTIAAVAMPMVRKAAIAIATSVAFVFFWVLWISVRVLFASERVVFVLAMELFISDRYGASDASGASAESKFIAT